MAINRQLMKLSMVVVVMALFVQFGIDGNQVVANQGGPPASRTGAPALGTFSTELTCNIAGCHTGNALNSGGGTLTISGLPATYTPNQEISVTVTMNRSSRARYGFELTALDAQGNRAGTLVITDSSRTQLINGSGGFAGRQYIEHNFGGSAPNGTNQGSWTFTWRAPSQNVGKVTFYAAGNAANGDGSSLGDFIYTTSASIDPAPVPNIASVSAASFTFALASEAISAGFGQNLSNNIISATSLPLPTELDGTSVMVNNTLASLFFVAPTQINYLIPSATANGEANVSVRRGGNEVAKGTVMIATVNPGLFSANANGQGVAAAVALRVKDGVQTFEPVAQFNSMTTRFEAIPIDLGGPTEQVFLIVFGTAFRGRSSLQNVVVTLGGEPLATLFADPAPGFVGLDQGNLGPISRNLIARGEVNLVFIVDGKQANIVTLNIK